MNIEYENAQVMAKQHPHTFAAPDLENMKRMLRAGDLVKVCAGCSVKVAVVDRDIEVTGETFFHLHAGSDKYAGRGNRGNIAERDAAAALVIHV